MQIFGTNTCINCGEKFDWTGNRDNDIDEDMHKLIRTNDNLAFARFTLASENKYEVTSKCSHCGSNNKFTYAYEIATY